MTSPDAGMPPAPETVPDPLLETLPGAIIDQQQSPCIMRIGVVAAIIEGTAITVKISGSEVLVDCSYLFGIYFPLLGDRVIILKQDSQWFCMGPMSGTIESNNPLPNSSFEQGIPPATPTGWSINVISSGAGVPTFETRTAGSSVLSGTQIADFGTDSVGAGTSVAEVFSPSIAALPNTKWTGAFYLVGSFLGSVPPEFSDLEFFIQFLDPAGVLIAEFSLVGLSLFVTFTGILYRRISLSSFPTGFVVAPAGTGLVRVKFLGTFRLPAATFVSFFLDNVILRQVD